MYIIEYLPRDKKWQYIRIIRWVEITCPLKSPTAKGWTFELLCQGLMCVLECHVAWYMYFVNLGGHHNYHKTYLQIILQTVIRYYYNYLWISLSKLLLLYVLCIKQFSNKLKTVNLLVWLKRTYNREWILCLIFKILFLSGII